MVTCYSKTELNLIDSVDKCSKHQLSNYLWCTHAYIIKKKNGKPNQRRKSYWISQRLIQHRYMSEQLWVKSQVKSHDKTRVRQMLRLTFTSGNETLETNGLGMNSLKVIFSFFTFGDNQNLKCSTFTCEWDPWERETHFTSGTSAVFGRTCQFLVWRPSPSRHRYSHGIYTPLELRIAFAWCTQTENECKWRTQLSRWRNRQLLLTYNLNNDLEKAVQKCPESRRLSCCGDV